MGKNINWKSNLNLSKSTNQNFTNIPHNMLIIMITYKANEKDIKVIITEESYTSKASFLDNDYIPTYGVDDCNANFSGKRVSRGRYISKDGTLINADVNGASNILKKVFPKAYDNIDLRNSGIVTIPISLLLIKTKAISNVLNSEKSETLRNEAPTS